GKILPENLFTPGSLPLLEELFSEGISFSEVVQKIKGKIPDYEVSLYNRGILTPKRLKDAEAAGSE
ncbi:MAG: hypothetical protein K2G23_06805, partial [Muribaculaceae bacterium]|nr:hypothetical protein [Muribaculaceae bacterium]